MEVKVVGLTKVTVEPGDYLYVQLPKDLSKKQLINACRNIEEFFSGQKVRVLSGDIEIKFSATKFEPVESQDETCDN